MASQQPNASSSNGTMSNNQVAALPDQQFGGASLNDNNPEIDGGEYQASNDAASQAFEAPEGSRTMAITSRAQVEEADAFYENLQTNANAGASIYHIQGTFLNPFMGPRLPRETLKTFLETLPLDEPNLPNGRTKLFADNDWMESGENHAHHWVGVHRNQIFKHLISENPAVDGNEVAVFEGTVWTRIHKINHVVLYEAAASVREAVNRRGKAQFWSEEYGIEIVVPILPELAVTGYLPDWVNVVRGLQEIMAGN